MAKGKKAIKKEKAEPKARGRFYEVSAKEAKELGPQAQLVYDAVAKHGPAQPATFAEALGEKLKTKQTPLKIVAFYLTTFKKAGLVKIAKGEMAAAAHA